MDEKTPDKKNDLFNNPMVDSAMKALTPEQLEEYQEMGKYMYSSNNFEEKNPQPKSLEKETVNGIFYIVEALKAGFHPKDMDKKELQLMYEIYGPRWYEEYDYEKEEVPEAPLPLEIKKEPPLTKKQVKNLEKKLRRKEVRKMDGVNHKKTK
jgi:hypothetical protein